MNISNKLTYICFVFLFGCSRTDANYDDCMLNNIKPNMSEQAVEAIQDSCLQKFVKPIPYTCVDRLMNKTELNNLQIYAGALKSKGIEFSVYNGNPNISLKTFTVSVSSKNFSDDQIYQVETKNLVKTPEQITYYICPIIGLNENAYNILIKQNEKKND